ncbi:MAG: PilC/PilY family type IV pilus protein [Desulfobacteraceae bacterium]
MKKFIWEICLLIWLWGAQTAVAEDTDILGAAAVAVEPNVMIIFDTSGSMGIEDIPANPYERSIDYTGGGGGYEKNAVYRWDNALGGWSKLIDRRALDQTCANAGMDVELDGNGQVWGRINTDSPYDCGEPYDELDLRLGNFLNYENGGYTGLTRKRLDVAKEVVKQLIDDHPNVRFGLMQFAQGYARHGNDTKGGKLSVHGDITKKPTSAQLKADVDAFLAESYTPLAETLAEAGLYFAGGRSWYNNVTYTSPIDIKCRPNHIILMTDGDSTKDQDPRLSAENAYINTGTIGDYDDDGNDPGVYDYGGSDYLDDVAAFLYQNDLMPAMAIGDPLYEKQNVITHTIGFKNTHQLLRETAENGGGTYFHAGSSPSLSRAFRKILNTIGNGALAFAPPSVPEGRAKGVYAGDYLYMGLFKADLNNGRWRGNLKKYKLNALGSLIDQNGRPATDSDGMFLASARSYWSEAVDGAEVDLGGAGALLVNKRSRNLYTYVDGVGADTHLTAAVNAFSKDNTDNLTVSLLGAQDTGHKDAIIDDIHGVDKAWVMGDVLHSEPVVVYYNTNGDHKIDEDRDALVCVGTNAGVMHAFRESSGEELWGFIPPQQLGRLKRLSDDKNVHDFFIDGPTAVVDYEINGVSKKALVFGERRGGSNYYALDITVPNDPIWKYRIGEEILGEGVEQLGQSWGRPQFATIATGPGAIAQVLLLPGGYDTNQDAEKPAEIDAKGRAVFSVVADSGVLSSFLFYNDGERSDMTHSIVDLAGVDTNGDGITNSIYAPDLGGNVFAFTDDDRDGTWRKLRLFDASGGDTQRKIFCSPDVIRIIGDPDPADDSKEEKVGEMIFFGTGDRAHPHETTVTNRFYAVKNYWWDTDFTTMTDIIAANGDGDLYNATDNPILQAETIEGRQKARDEIIQRMGWFVDLEGDGEKVVSSPVVYNQTVYFTTYVPPASSSVTTDDDCDRDDAVKGEARLYGLNYKDGRAVHDDWSDVKEYDPVTREEIKSGGKADRYRKIGSSMPSAPKVAIRDGISMLYVGADDRLFAIAPKEAVEMNMYYWREIKP